MRETPNRQRGAPDDEASAQEAEQRALPAGLSGGARMPCDIEGQVSQQ
jgi:hypothetical protein